MRYLYHYTSVETLALILKNKTICFNNLLYVDDIEEAQSQDMDNFGKFVYVSCWTDDEEESIPLWNLYTPNMHGVRIKLPVFPFKKYQYEKGELFFTEDTQTYIDCKSLFNDNKMSVVANSPKLIKVEYTNEDEKLFPKVKRESFPGALQKFLVVKDLSELEEKNIKVEYSFEEIGKYKRENWRFQREWRYKITASPMGIRESNSSTFEMQQELLRRIEDKNTIPPYQRIFLCIDDNAFEDMEVLLGPKMSEAEKIIVVALLNQYAPKCTYRDSNLKIR